MGADCVCCNQSLVTIVWPLWPGGAGAWDEGDTVTAPGHCTTTLVSTNQSPVSDTVTNQRPGLASHLIIALEWQWGIMSHSGHRPVIDHNQTIIRHLIMGRPAPALCPDQATDVTTLPSKDMTRLRARPPSKLAIYFFIDQRIERISVWFKMWARSFTQYCAHSLISHPLVWAHPIRVHTSPNCVNWGEDKSRTLFGPNLSWEKCINCWYWKTFCTWCFDDSFKDSSFCKWTQINRDL